MANTSIEDGQVAAALVHLGERTEVARSFYAGLAQSSQAEDDQLALEELRIRERLEEIAKVRVVLRGTIESNSRKAGDLHEEGVRITALRDGEPVAKSTYVKENLFDRFERNLRRALNMLPAAELSEDEGQKDQTLEGAYLIAFLLNPSLVEDEHARAELGISVLFAFDRYNNGTLGKRFYSDTMMRFLKKAIEIGLLSISDQAQLERTLRAHVGQTASNDTAL